jgi:uncharacterized protein YkwD
MKTSRLLALNPGDGKARELRLSKREVTVGSDAGNDLTVVGPGVSRRHAVIRYRAGRYELLDLRSTNGIFVNGSRITTPVLLKDADEIRFGTARFAFLDHKDQEAKIARINLRTRLELLAALFLLGAMITLYAINRGYLNRNQWRGSLLQPPIPSAAPAVELPQVAPEQQKKPKGVSHAERPPVKSKAALSATQPTPSPSTPPPRGPTPSPSIVATAQPDWLSRINYYRTAANLALVRSDPVLSAGDFYHSRYLVKEMLAGRSPSADAHMHQEDTSSQWYTNEGQRAAEGSNIIPPCRGCSPISQTEAIDEWIKGPFHRMGILEPTLSAAGFGDYAEDGLSAYALYLPPIPRQACENRHAIEFPPNDSRVPLSVYPGLEWPDPLTSCPSYSAPTGLPITLQLGAWEPAHVTSHSIQLDGTELEHCEFDASNYANPDASAQAWAGQILNGNSAVVLIPRRPLAKGRRYTVSIGALAKTYNWSFTIGD